MFIINNIIDVLWREFNDDVTQDELQHYKTFYGKSIDFRQSCKYSLEYFIANIDKFANSIYQVEANINEDLAPMASILKHRKELIKHKVTEKRIWDTYNATYLALKKSRKYERTYNAHSISDAISYSIAFNDDTLVENEKNKYPDVYRLDNPMYLHKDMPIKRRIEGFVGPAFESGKPSNVPDGYEGKALFQPVKKNVISIDVKVPHPGLYHATSISMSDSEVKFNWTKLKWANTKDFSTDKQKTRGYLSSSAMSDFIYGSGITPT